MIVFQDHCEILVPVMVEDRYTTVAKPDWTVPPAEAIPARCVMSPLGSSETVGDRATVTTRYRLLVPVTAPLNPDRRVRHRGIVYSVDGDAERHSLAGRDHHLEVILKRVTG